MKKNYTFVPGAEFPFQYKYEHMAVAMDCVIFTFEDKTLKVLLIKRGIEPYKDCWAFPGGFLRNTETAREGALRELQEETSLPLQISEIEEVGVFSDPARDPRERTISIAWYALVRPSDVVGGDDAALAQWIPVDELPQLAFDHKTIFDAAMERLRQDIHFKPVGFNLLDEEFTIPDLHRLYEAILGEKMDRSNFQRKVLASGILEKVAPKGKDEDDVVLFNNINCILDNDIILYDGSEDFERFEEPVIHHTRKIGPGRAGTLYRLNRDKYDDLKKKGGKTEF